jgi:hypothetical protein
MHIPEFMRVERSDARRRSWYNPRLPTGLSTEAPAKAGARSWALFEIVNSASWIAPLRRDRSPFCNPDPTQTGKRFHASLAWHHGVDRRCLQVTQTRPRQERDSLQIPGAHRLYPAAFAWLLLNAHPVTRTRNRNLYPAFTERRIAFASRTRRTLLSSKA